MTCCLSRWLTAAVLWIALTSLAHAETLAETVEQWGLLGSWAVDCAVSPDRDKGALLTYEIRKDGRVMYGRNFGDAKDENEVVSAMVNAEGLLNVMVYFPSLQQTRECEARVVPSRARRRELIGAMVRLCRARHVALGRVRFGDQRQRFYAEAQADRALRQTAPARPRS